MKNNFIFAVGLMCVLGGFLIPFWPLEALAVIIFGLSGRTVPALTLGVFLDVLYGAPVGLWSITYAPFTLLSLASVALEVLTKRYVV